MATQPNPWEIDWTQQQAPPVVRPGRPNLPSPQTPAQAELDRAQAENARLQGILRQREVDAGPAAQAAEAERKAAAFFTRALGANRSYEVTGVGAPPRGLSFVPNELVSEERQRAISAQDEFIAASLRQDSGAAIPPEELERQRQIYFPEPGDLPRTLVQKANARRRALEGLINSAGRSLRPQDLEAYQQWLTTIATPTDTAVQTANEAIGAVVQDGQLPQPGEPGPAHIPPSGTPLDPSRVQRGGQGESQYQNGGTFIPPEEQEIADTMSAMIAQGATRRDLDAYLSRYGRVVSDADWGGIERARRAGSRIIVDPRETAMQERRTTLGTLIADNLPESMGSTAAGIANTVTLNADDEIAGFSSGVNSLMSGNSYSEGYDRGVGDYRQARSYVQDRNPITYTGGQLLGGFALPGGQVTGIGRRIAVGSGLGAIYGFNSEGDVRDRGTSALIGAGIGAGVPVAMRAGSAVRSAFAPAAGSTAAERAAERVAVGQAAERQGIDLLPADVGGPMIRRVTAGAAQTPFASGPIVRGAQRTEAQAGARRDNLVGAVGEAVEPEGAGEAARRGGRSFIDRTRERSNQLYGAAEAEAGDARVQLTRARAALDQHISELAETPGNPEGLTMLRQLREQLDGDFTVAGVRRMRTTLRDQFASSGLRGSDIERRVGQVVEAASEDIAHGLVGQGRGGAARAYQTADRYYRNRVRTIDEVLEPIMGGNVSGEEIVQRLQRASQGNTRRLAEFMRALPAEEASTIRATVISQLGRPTAGSEAGRNFSLNQFLTQWNKMTPRARRVLFDGETYTALNDLATVARGARQSAGYANRSNTGGATQVGETARALSYLGGWSTLGATALVENLTGRMLAWPAFARWLARAPRTPTRGYIGRLTNIASRNPSISQEVLGLQQRLLSAMNDNLPLSAAAESGGGDNRY